MKKLLLSILMIGIATLGYSQGETCETAEVVTAGTYTATGPSTGTGAANICFPDGGTAANWYSYTPDADYIVTIGSCLGGADTRLSVYDGDCNALNCVASNDDECEVTAGGSLYASMVTFNAMQGSTYLIEWDDRWSANGFDWSLTETTPPSCTIEGLSFFQAPCQDTNGDLVFLPVIGMVFEISGDSICHVEDLTFSSDSSAAQTVNLPSLGFNISDGDTLYLTGTTADINYNFNFNLNSGDTSIVYTYLNGNCDSVVLGCTDSTACNYDSMATNDNGTCTFPGCLDSTALNFDPLAACEDASTCIYPPVCGDTWTDLGGTDNDYDNNSSLVYTICPENEGDVVTVAFSFFDIEDGWDYMTIYNGADTTATLIGEFTGIQDMGSFTSTDTSGCLTFFFVSDGSVTHPGWVAEILCGPPPSCFPPTQVTASNVFSTSAEISWVAADTTASWLVEVVLAGDTATGVGVATNDNPYMLTGLTPETAYDVYVIADCGDNGLSEWVGPVTFTTMPLPPDNDLCMNAAPLTIDTICVIDSTSIFSNVGATSSDIDPGCAAFSGGEVWFSFVSNGNDVTVETSAADGITDTGMALYMGTCDNLTLVACDDDGGDGFFSMVQGTDLTAGETYYVAVWEYGNNNFGDFAICAYETPATDCSIYTGGPWIDFNLTFGGAPVADENGECPVNQITTFEVWANEAYTVDGFTEGVEYTFSICEGPGAGSWDPELVVMDTLFNVIEGPVQACEITWTCAASGTYLIGINEAGVCGPESTNLSTDNGYPTLTCTGNVSVHEIENTIDVVLFPNPITDQLNISLDGLTTNKTIVSIVSLQGKVVMNKEYSFQNGTTRSIDVSDLANGIYMVQIINGEAITTKKIIIE